jgi:hypothetical protein
MLQFPAFEARRLESHSGRSGQFGIKCRGGISGSCPTFSFGSQIRREGTHQSLYYIDLFQGIRSRIGSPGYGGSLSWRCKKAALPCEEVRSELGGRLLRTWRKAAQDPEEVSPGTGGAVLHQK